MSVQGEKHTITEPPFFPSTPVLCRYLAIDVPFMGHVEFHQPRQAIIFEITNLENIYVFVK